MCSSHILENVWQSWMTLYLSIHHLPRERCNQFGYVLLLLVSDDILIRKSRVDYADNVYHMAGPKRPNPFRISRIAHFGEAGLGSRRGRNAMLTFFGEYKMRSFHLVNFPMSDRLFSFVVVLFVFFSAALFISFSPTVSFSVFSYFPWFHRHD